MAALDLVFVAVLLLSMLLGTWRGLVYELLSLVNWVAALLLAQWLAQDVAQHLPMRNASEMVRYAAGFVLVFVSSVLLGGLVAALARKLISTVGLRPVDRVLGAVFGLLRGMLLLLLATVLVSMTALKDSAVWQQSVGAGACLVLLKTVKPAMPPEVGRFLPV